MEVYILNERHERIAVVDTYKSLIWTKEYYGIGECELYVPADEPLMEILAIDRYIQRSDDDMLCHIVSVELQTDSERGDFIVAQGLDCKSWLAQRIVWTQTNFYGTAEDCIRNLIDSNLVSPTDPNRKIPNVVLGERVGFDDYIENQCTYVNLAEKVESICRAFGYGLRFVYDEATSQSIATLYKGVDRSQSQLDNPSVTFSDDYENIVSSDYIKDIRNHRTTALVAGEGEGVDRRTLEYGGEASGIARKELYVDARDLSSVTDEGDEIDYDSALEARAVESLAEYAVITAFEGTVIPNVTYTYKTDYNLGDLVTIANRYGITVHARIVEIIESFDDSGHSIIPRFEYEEIA